MQADLTDTEVDAICAGLVQSHAKVRYLEQMGLTVRKKPNGRPLVNRAHYDSVMGCGQQAGPASHAAGPVWGVH